MAVQPPSWGENLVLAPVHLFCYGGRAWTLSDIAKRKCPRRAGGFGSGVLWIRGATVL